MATASMKTRRVTHYGIEVLDGITWRGWEPGREYTKQLILKNVKIQTQKIRYRLPESHFFTTVYPQPIILSAGTTFSLPIIFKPEEKAIYEDAIKFETSDGKFDISVRAVLPKADLSVPETLKFGMCASGDTTEIEFQISNTSDVETTFMWDVSEPFDLEPRIGVLRPREACPVKASFRPQAASVYEERAVCTFEGSNHKGINLKGIGKFPHLVVSVSSGKVTQGEVVVNFGQVAVETVAEKWLELKNTSPVNAPFQIKLKQSPANKIDSVFSCSHYQGCVAPQAVEKIKVFYKPHTPDVKSVDYFKVKASGGFGGTLVKCQGTAKGPHLRLSCTHLNFGNVASGTTVTRMMQIENKSDVAATFQFLVDSASVFRFDTHSGCVRPGGSLTVIIHFSPTHPITYCRQIACLVHNQEPLFIDLLGLCHTEQVRPASLEFKHLINYRQRKAAGLSHYPPELLNELLKAEKVSADDNGKMQVVSDDVEIFPQPEYKSGWDELMDGCTPLERGFEPHISLEVDCFDFGACVANKTILVKTVNLTNHTKGKITCQWLTRIKEVFHILPDNREILPGKTSSFTVTFRPDTIDHFYGKELECYAFFNSMSDRRLFNDLTATPPWCLTLTVLGHTFSSEKERFLPRLTFSTEKIVFQPVSPGWVSFRTLLFNNTGDTPVKFRFEEDPDGFCTCKPIQSVMSDEHQIVVFGMKPGKVASYHRQVNCMINEADKHQKKFELVGSAENPVIKLENEGSLFFKPTCIGTVSSRPLQVKNLSRIPLNFSWQIPASEAHLLRVRPSRGLLLPNEQQNHMWSFSPDQDRKYGFRCSLIVSSNVDLLSSPTRLGLVARGEGSLGRILCRPEDIDLGDIVVGTSLYRQLTLHNVSDCSLHYRLKIELEASDEKTKFRIPLMGKQALHLDCCQSELASGAQQTIRITARPGRRVGYKFTISYELLKTSWTARAESPEVAQTETPLCCVSMRGVYPTLSVVDARGQGSAAGWNKVKVWNMFKFKELNRVLHAEPSSAEVKYTLATRHSTRRRSVYHTPARIDFDFGAAPVDSDPCIITLMVENTSTVQADWALLFPTDVQMEMEYWAETGQMDDEEERQTGLFDNEVFSITPREGSLMPGETQTITLSYQHLRLFSGTNKIPVLLKISRGREILLTLIGTTVRPGQQWIHFPALQHKFNPVAIGLEHPPVQVYELFNGGAEPVQYEIDTLPLQRLRDANFDCPILSCLAAAGSIPPGQSVSIPWLFSPVEAKVYTAEIPIRIIDGSTTTVTFIGEGFDARLVPAQNDSSGDGIPDKQTVPVSSQLAYFSRERVIFGKVPLYASLKRLIYLTNPSGRHTVSFAWQLGSHAEVVSVEPISGLMSPGQSVPVKIALYSTKGPCHYDFSIICQVVDETAMLAYRAKLERWEDKEEMKKNTFTITERDFKKDDTKKPSSASKLSKSLNKYQTLPPIGGSKSYEEWKRTDLSRKSNARPRIGNSGTVKEKPVPPHPFHLHLGVIAHTVDLHDYAARYGEPEHCFINVETANPGIFGFAGRCQTACSSVSSILSAGAIAPARRVNVTKEELEAIKTAVSAIMKSCTEDNSFHQALESIEREPVPYFVQLSGSRKQTVDIPRTPTSPCEFAFLTSRESSPNRQNVVPSATEDMRSSVSGEMTPEPERPFKAGSSEEIENEELFRLPEVRNLVESVVENTLFNLLCESGNDEFSITARQRLVCDRLPVSQDTDTKTWN
eukprot:m.21985 g.21985  ORF g.21985 m.21985 type:complete len:1729 (+) comp28260_c0_seq1:44-5230(+)